MIHENKALIVANGTGTGPNATSGLMPAGEQEEEVGQGIILDTTPQPTEVTTYPKETNVGVTLMFVLIAVAAFIAICALLFTRRSK